MRKIILCDIDYTLLGFAHEKGMLALCRHISSKLPKNLEQVITLSAFIDRVFHSQMDAGRGVTSSRIVELKRSISEESKNILGDDFLPTTLDWSRELWLKMVCKNSGVRTTAEAIVKACGAYWKAIGANSELYEDAKEFLAWIELSPWELVLVSSSDARLSCSEENKLVYDPSESSQRKIDRIPNRLKELASAIVIGDPISKPSPIFWTRTLDEIECNPQKDRLVMIGDSYESDIAGIGQWNINGILIDREQKTRHEQGERPELLTSVSSLTEVQEILSSA